MTTLVILPALIGGLALGAFLTWPIAHRAGTRAAARDQEEISRILTGVQIPVVQPAVVPVGWVQWARERREWLQPAPRAIATPVRLTPAYRVANTPASYRPKHSLVLAHLRADAYIGRPPLVAELVSA